jgi:hypothetical protein
MAFPPVTATPPALNLYEFNFGGVTFGGLNNLTEAFPFIQASGLGSPPIRSADDDRPYDQGSFVGVDLYGARPIMVEIVVRAFGGLTFQQNKAALKAALQLGGNVESPLYFNTGYGVQAVMARFRGMPDIIDLNRVQANATTVQLSFQASDPRIYSTPTLEATCSTGSDVGGWVFPWTFPWTFTPGIVSGSVVAVNGGDFEMRPIIVLTGPLTNPTITNSSIPGSPSLTFAVPGGSGLTLVAGALLVIDTDLHSVTYFTPGSTVGASRENWVVQGPSTWFDLPPGSNLINLTSLASSDTGTMTVEYASATDAA